MAGETPTVPGGAVDQSKLQLDALMKRLLSMGQPQTQMTMPQPRVQYSPQDLAQKGYNTQVNVNKRADLGQAIGNMGTFVGNMVAQHKQNQIRDAANEWDGFNRALEKAQALAGDPTAPDYQQKVQQMLSQDPYVKANLDPSNPKAVKRLKNMYKALNVDLMSDEQNVHREGLKRFFKQDAALKKVQQAKAAMDKNKQQPQGMDPAQRQKQFQESLSKLTGNISRTDPKQNLEIAKVEMEGLKLAEQVKALQERPKTLDEHWYRMKTQELGHEPSSEVIEAHEQARAEKPIDQHIQKAMDAASAGDWKTADAEFAIAHKGAQAKGRDPKPDIWTLLQTAQKGGPEGAKAQAVLDAEEERRGRVAEHYGAGRAMFAMGNYIDAEGVPQTMSAYDAAERIKNGEALTYMGPLSGTQVVQYQRLKTEGYPAVAAVKEYTKAFDSEQNRAVFARVLANPPAGEDGFLDWLKNGMDQALQSKGLDSDGIKLVNRMKRLADTMGTMRAALGLPSTETSIHLMMQMMPGPKTPSSKVANDLMDQLEQIMNNAIDIPMYRKMNKNPRVFGPDDQVADPNN